jgi:hypothetical protein
MTKQEFTEKYWATLEPFTLEEFEADLEKLMANYRFKVKAEDLVDDLAIRLDKIGGFGL